MPGAQIARPGFSFSPEIQMVALADLQPASFRGVRFLVPRDTAEEGRNLVEHSFPDANYRYVEDNGYCPPKFQVTAVLHGAGLMGQFNALRAALNRPGPATLQHPWYGAQFVAAKEWKVTREDTDSGVLTFEITFLVTSPPLFPGVLSAIPALVTGLSSAFMGSAFSALSGAFGSPLLSAVSMGIVSGALNSVTSTFSSALGAAEGVATSVRHLVDQPEYHLSSGAILGPELNALFRGAFDDDTYSGSEIVRGLTKVESSIDHVDAQAATIIPNTLDYAARQSALTTISTFCRLATVSAMAEAMAGATYTTAERVSEAKDKLLVAYSKIRVEGFSSDLGQQIAKVVSAALDVLHQQELQLPKIDTIMMQPDLPASVLAYMLYDTDARTDTIVDLNLDANPLLIEHSARVLSEA